MSCTFHASQDNVMLCNHRNICEFTKFIRILFEKCDVVLQTELWCSNMYRGMFGIVVEC